MTRQRPRTGFSLLELLVVLAILGVLLTLTAGAVQRSRASYQRVERLAWMEARRHHNPTGTRSLPIRVLFIGNSYTSVNDLPGTLQALADASGAQPRLIVESITAGGARLKTHWDDGAAVERIRSAEWDFVVLQEQSQTPLMPFGRNQFFVPYAKKFAEVVRDRGAIPVLYLTWPRPDTPGFPQRDYTTSVVDLAKELRAEVAPAGLAKEAVEAQLPAFNFYADSGGHPTAAGTYLAACTFFATIYDRSPEGLPASVTTAGGAVVGVSATEAPVVQRAAASALVTVKKLLDRDPERRSLR